MLSVTPTACSRLSEMLSDYPGNVAARIVLRDGRMKLRPSMPRADDEVVEHQGRTVLLLDEAMVERLNGRTLDVRTTEDGPKLRFRRTPRSNHK